MNGGAITATAIAASNIRIICLDCDCPPSLPPRGIHDFVSPCQPLSGTTIGTDLYQYTMFPHPICSNAGNK